MKSRIKEIREILRITQSQLADKIGVSRQAINSIETGKYEPSIWLAYDISRVFCMSIEEVFLFEISKRESRAEKSRRR